MANSSALQLHEDLELFEHHLDTFIMMSEMGMMPKEASVVFHTQLTGISRSVAAFQAGHARNDGMAKQASASLSQHAMDLAGKLDSGSQQTAGAAQRFKEVLSSARKTWLSRDALNRMMVI